MNFNFRSWVDLPFADFKFKIKQNLNPGKSCFGKKNVLVKIFNLICMFEFDSNLSNSIAS